MTSLEDAGGDSGSLAGHARSPSCHGRNPTARETGGDLSEVDRYALAVRYAMELSLGRNACPKA